MSAPQLVEAGLALANLLAEEVGRWPTTTWPPPVR